MKKTYYKLTDKNGKTQKNTEWKPGKTVRAAGKGEVKCCSNTAVHAYTSPELAMMLTPLHNSILSGGRMFEVTGEAEHVCWDKIGARELRCEREIPCPEVPVEARVRFAIYVATTVYKEASFLKWARAWLSGEARSKRAADAASYAADAAAAAADAANAAANAAAAYAAAADAAADAANAAAYAAGIDLDKLAKEAIDDEKAFQESNAVSD